MGCHSRLMLQPAQCNPLRVIHSGGPQLPGPQHALCRQAAKLLDLVTTVCTENKVRKWIPIETEDVVQTKGKSSNPQAGN